MTELAKRHVIHVWCGILSFLLLTFALLMCGCSIPVSVRPEADAAGKPIPVLTAIEPRQDAQGKPIPLAVAETQPAPLQARPEFADVATKAAPLPVPPGFDWTNLLTILGVVVGAAGGGWGIIAQRAIGTLKTALTATATHADRMERAETDADVEKAKDQSNLEQRILGVIDVIAKARGKA